MLLHYKYNEGRYIPQPHMTTLIKDEANYVQQGFT